MDRKANDLRQIRGVGEITAARLVDAGLDSFEKIVSAGENVLKGIKGLNAHVIAAILAHAAELAKEAEDRNQTLHETATHLTGLVNALALRTKISYGEKLRGCAGKKVELEFLKISSLLDGVKTKAKSRKRVVERCLCKAEKRLAAVSDQTLKDLYKGLRKTRKALKKIGVAR